MRVWLCFLALLLVVVQCGYSLTTSEKTALEELLNRYTATEQELTVQMESLQKDLIESKTLQKQLATQIQVLEQSLIAVQTAKRELETQLVSLDESTETLERSLIASEQKNALLPWLGGGLVVSVVVAILGMIF